METPISEPTPWATITFDETAVDAAQETTPCPTSSVAVKQER
jgi:hypothetical protein